MKTHVKKTSHSLLLGAALFLAIGGAASAASYLGNSSTDFGGAIGQGSLTLIDDGTTVTGTITKGPGNFNDVLVLYIDTGTGGFSDTSGFADSADGLRKAISGFDGGTNRSALTFSGMTPAYAIALGPASDSFGGLWQLTNGGANSLNFVSSANLTPLNNSAATYVFSFSISQLGLRPNSGATIKILGTYISNTGYRSTEALAGNATGTTGWSPFTQSAVATYNALEFHVIQSVVSGSNLNVTFSTKAGRAYSLEGSPDLINWTAVSGSAFTGDGNPHTSAVDITANPTKYFVRVLIGP